MKSFSNTNTADTTNSGKDVHVVGNPDIWILICKASSEEQGWMKSTKAMQLENGIVLQVTSEHRQPNGGIYSAEAIQFLPGCKIVDENGEKKIV